MDGSTSHTRENALLRLCARPHVSSEVVNTAGQLLSGQIDWTYLIRAGVQHQLIPLVDRTLQLVGEPGAPADILHALRLRVEKNYQRNQYLANQSFALGQSLATAGVQTPILIHGPPLTETVYGDLSLSQAGGVSFLVCDGDLAVAHECLSSQRFHKKAQNEDEYFVAGPLARSTCYQRISDRMTLVMHSVPLDDCSSGAAKETLWNRATTLKYEDGEVVVPTPDDHLIALCLQGEREQWRMLGTLADIAHLLHRHSEFDVGLVLDRSRALGCESVSALGLTLAGALVEVKQSAVLNSDEDATEIWARLLPTEPVSSEPLPPEDARVATEQDESRLPGHLSIPNQPQEREVATPAVKNSHQREAGWNWKWALVGLSAAAIAAYIIIPFLSAEVDRPVVTVTRESHGEDEPTVASRARLGPEAPERVETPLENSPTSAPLDADTAITAFADGSGRNEGREPSPVAGESVIVSADPMAVGLLDPSAAGTPAIISGVHEKGYKVGITEEWSSIDVMHDGENIEVKRIQDTDNRLLDDFSKTSRPCPPFCIHPITVFPGVTTVGEVEVLQFLKGAVESGAGLLVDARMQKWHKAETIPGSINIPFIVFTASREIPTNLLLELGVTEKQGKLNYDDALSLLLYCNGPWCDQSPRAIKALLRIGYPPERLYYYRGGMQSWKQFGLTTVIPRVQ